LLSADTIDNAMHGEFCVVSYFVSVSAFPIHSTSPTGLKGDASPFARRNDIIRNSLSSLTASLDLTRPAVGGAANRKLSSATACVR
jgi:hypothetical protein